MKIEGIAKPKQVDKEERPEKWYIELKYDGTRQFLLQDSNNTKLLNKRGTNKTRHFPDITKKVDLPENTILDGETIVTDDLHPHGNKNVLQKRDGGQPVIRESGKTNFTPKMKMKQYPATFVAFDVLQYKGNNMRELEIEKRREKLKEIVKQLSDCVKISTRFDDFSRAWARVTEKKMEGLILKKPESKYPEGRTSKWRKVKNIKDTILTVKDYEEHNKGITAIGEDEESSNHRFTVNGTVSKKVKEAIEEDEEAKVEISYLERSKNGMFREPRYKRLAE